MCFNLRKSLYTIRICYNYNKKSIQQKDILIMSFHAPNRDLQYLALKIELRSQPEEPRNQPEEPRNQPEEPRNQPEEPEDQPEQRQDQPEEPRNQQEESRNQPRNQPEEQINHPEEQRNQPEEPRNQPKERRNQPEELRNEPKEPRNQPEEPRNHPEELTKTKLLRYKKLTVYFKVWLSIAHIGWQKWSSISTLVVDIVDKTGELWVDKSGEVDETGWYELTKQVSCDKSDWGDKSGR